MILPRDCWWARSKEKPNHSSPPQPVGTLHIHFLKEFIPPKHSTGTINIILGYSDTLWNTASQKDVLATLVNEVND